MNTDSCVGYLDIFCFLQTPIIGPNHEVHLYVANNPLTCDCRDYDIIAKLGLLTFSHWLDGVDCNLPSELYGQKVSYIDCNSVFTHSVLQYSFSILVTIMCGLTKKLHCTRTHILVFAELSDMGSFC